MWKAAAGQSVTVAVDNDGDDWETDPDFEVTPHHFLHTHSHSNTHRLTPS